MQSRFRFTLGNFPLGCKQAHNRNESRHKHGGLDEFHSVADQSEGRRALLPSQRQWKHKRCCVWTGTYGLPCVAVIEASLGEWKCTQANWTLSETGPDWTGGDVILAPSLLFFFFISNSTPVSLKTCNIALSCYRYGFFFNIL